MDFILVLNLVFGSLGFYLLIGIGFALFLVWEKRFLARLDPQSKGGSFGFRMCLLPGLTVFWPIFLRRIIGGHLGTPEAKDTHRKEG